MYLAGFKLQVPAASVGCDSNVSSVLKLLKSYSDPFCVHPTHRLVWTECPENSAMEPPAPWDLLFSHKGRSHPQGLGPVGQLGAKAQSTDKQGEPGVPPTV